MKVRPLHDRIIIERIDEGEQKVGGIIIPDTAKEKPQQGKVIAVGKGRVEKDGKELWKRTDLGKWEHTFGSGASIRTQSGSMPRSRSPASGAARGRTPTR